MSNKRTNKQTVSIRTKFYSSIADSKTDMVKEKTRAFGFTAENVKSANAKRKSYVLKALDNPGPNAHHIQNEDGTISSFIIEDENGNDVTAEYLRQTRN